MTFTSPLNEAGMQTALHCERKQFYKIGAIDIGTNSTHLVVAIVDSVLNTFRIEVAEKSTTRLGECDPETGILTDDAIKRTLETLDRFKELSKSYEVEHLIVAATSAVREAPNRNEFLIQAKEKLGLEIDLISGLEEARLIYLGVLSGMPFGNSPNILLDIGGGSTELILANNKDAKALSSTRIGAVRLKRDFFIEEPLSTERRDFIQTFIQGSLEPAVNKLKSRIKAGEEPKLIATSGTALAIGSLVSKEDPSDNFKLHGYKFPIIKLNKLVDQLIKMNPDQRKKLEHINDRRAEIIVPGALILQKTMKMLDMKEVILSERALREGLIFDWMLRNHFTNEEFGVQSDIRNTTVIHQAQRFSVNERLSKRVAKHSLFIYEKTFGILHHDKGEYKDLLWAASMLHSCGQHVNRSGYHKHSWYLIRYGELLGYSQSEHLMVAAIARYHRRSLPKKRHEAWQALEEPSHRKAVLELSLILRLSVALECRPNSNVELIDINSDKYRITFNLREENSGNSIRIEEWSLINCSNIVKELTGLDLCVLSN